jgi:hypothetical protein
MPQPSAPGSDPNRPNWFDRRWNAPA